MGGQMRVAEDTDDHRRDDHRHGRQQAIRQGKPARWVRQLVSATTVWRRPANQPSADFTFAIC